MPPGGMRPHPSPSRQRMSPGLSGTVPTASVPRRRSLAPMLDGLGLSSRLTAARDQVSCDLGSEAPILQIASGIYYGLNPVGACVWALLQQRTPYPLLAEYDVAPRSPRSWRASASGSPSPRSASCASPSPTRDRHSNREDPYGHRDETERGV